MSEFDLIRTYFAATEAPRDDVVLGIGDDAALLDPAEFARANADRSQPERTPANGRAIAQALANRGADRSSNPAEQSAAIGAQALAEAGAKLAVRGIRPAWMTLGLCMPGFEADWLQRFANALQSRASACGIALVGGDTTRGPLQVTVSIQGLEPPGPDRRATPQAGDALVSVAINTFEPTLALAAAGATLALADAGARTACENLLRTDRTGLRCEFTPAVNRDAPLQVCGSVSLAALASVTSRWPDTCQIIGQIVASG